MAASSGYDSVDAAPYLLGTINDYSSNENIFGSMFAQPEQVDSTSGGYMAQQAQAAAGGSTPANVDIYEVNLGTVTGVAASQNQINQVAAGTGSGIAVADHMLLDDPRRRHHDAKHVLPARVDQRIQFWRYGAALGLGHRHGRGNQPQPAHLPGRAIGQQRHHAHHAVGDHHRKQSDVE